MNAKVFSREAREQSKAMGFTLVELLVVIAIICILAGLLLPTLSRAKDTSRGIICVNNLKQTGLAQSNYSMDYDNWILLQAASRSDKLSWFYTLSGTYTSPYSQNYGVTFRMASFYYFETMGTFACPSERVPFGLYTDSPPKFNYLHYGLNNNLCGYYDSSGNCLTPGRKVNVVTRASVAVFAADTNHRAGSQIGSGPGLYLLSYRHGAADPRPVTVYQDAYATYPASAFRGKTNVLYFDGHVMGRTVTELSSQKDDAGVSSVTSFAKAGIKL